MKDAVIFHPARTIGETAGAAVEMGQNEMVAEYTESAHPYKQLAEVLHIADETKNRTGYVLFPKVTKFNTWLLSRYGKRLEAELTEGIMAGKYAVTMGLNDVTAAHISCRFSPRILGLFRLETAAPSRANFRKIPGWGYRPKNQNQPPFFGRLFA